MRWGARSTVNKREKQIDGRAVYQWLCLSMEFDWNICDGRSRVKKYSNMFEPCSLNEKTAGRVPDRKVTVTFLGCTLSKSSQVTVTCFFHQNGLNTIKKTANRPRHSRQMHTLHGRIITISIRPAALYNSSMACTLPVAVLSADDLPGKDSTDQHDRTDICKRRNSFNSIMATSNTKLRPIAFQPSSNPFIVILASSG